LHNIYLLDYLHRYYPKRFVVSLYIYNIKQKGKKFYTNIYKRGPVALYKTILRNTLGIR